MAPICGISILFAGTGIIGASVVLLGLLSMPVMLNQGYFKSLACGTICGAGKLGILIPPSIMLVMMADRLGLPSVLLPTYSLLSRAMAGLTTASSRSCRSHL